MSMENAILEHASALRELSAAIKTMHAGRADVLSVGLAAQVGETVRQSTADTESDVKAADAKVAGAKEQAAKKQESVSTGGETVAAAEQGSQAAGAASSEGVAEVVKEVSDEIEKKDTVAADLDYAKDVRPVLLAAIKKAGKDTVAAMLKTFGVDKADQLKAEQLPAALAKAQALAA